MPVSLKPYIEKISSKRFLCQVNAYHKMKRMLEEADETLDFISYRDELAIGYTFFCLFKLEKYWSNFMEWDLITLGEIRDYYGNFKSSYCIKGLKIQDEDLKNYMSFVRNVSELCDNNVSCSKFRYNAVKYIIENTWYLRMYPSC